MTGLALQIDGKWAVLDEDVSVSIEDNSPVWGDGNSFSLPFSLSVEANRHILGNSDQITGQSVYEVLDGRRAVLYTLGIPVYYGKIKMDDEVEIADGYVDVTLVSGNLTFDEMIDGMNCQDVELMDEIIVGERVDEFTVNATDLGLNTGSMSGYFPTSFMWMESNGVSTVNVSKAYPDAKYCNIRVCYQIPEENQEGENYDGGLSEYQSSLINKIYNPELFGNYVVLSEQRSNSGLCFFVLYFLDCLFHKLGYHFSNEGIKGIEDMRRLAFCSTRCGYDTKDANRTVSNSGIKKNWLYGYDLDQKQFFYTWTAPLKKCVANSKNFPNSDVSDVIACLKNGFGIRFLFDNNTKSAKCIYIKDVLKNNEYNTIIPLEIYEVNKEELNTKGFRLTYNGNDDDTAYNYHDWNERVQLIDDYNSVVGATSPYDKNLYIDTRIGNAYRVKIDEEATSSSEANPALFEVGTFNAAEYGDCSDEESTEIVEIGFTPVTMNDVYGHKRAGVVRASNRTTSRAGSSDTENNDQMFAFFLNGIDLKYPSWVPKIKLSFTVGRYQTEIYYSYFEDQRFDESRTDQSKDAYYERRDAHRKEGKSKSRRGGIGGYITADQFENNSPVQEFDTGIMFGIMRGPGNDSGIEEFAENYDGEGNIRYVTTSTTPSFHSDTVDNYARVWDYNGKESGGVSQEGRFSLKLRAEKPNPEGGFYPITNVDAQRRGLFDKFYTEYAYFVVNRKIVKMVCRMEIADVLNIDWTKRYKIGDYTGFINKYSYTVDSTGMSDVTIEMYYV